MMKYSRPVCLGARFDDLFAFALFGPIVQIASGSLVQHLRRDSEGGCQLLGLFETFVLAFVDDFRLAAIDTAIDEFASGFQNVLGSGNAFSGISFPLGDEFVQFGGQRRAFGLTFLIRCLVQVDQAADARFEIIFAAQFEQG